MPKEDKTNTQHHYLPKMYLRFFADNDKIAIWDRNKGFIRLGNVQKIARVKGFYTFKDKKGNKSDELEELLADIEGQTKTIISNINSLFPHPISGDTKQILSQYLAFQHLRTPENRKQLEQSYDMIIKMHVRANLHSKEAAIKSLEDAGINVNDNTLKQISEFMDNPHSFVIVPSKEEIIGLQLNNFKPLTAALLNRDWNIITFDEPCLITSDSPILMMPDKSKRGWKFRGVGFKTAKEIWFPLTSTRLLILTLPRFTGPKTLNGSPDLAQEANELQLNSSHLEAYGLPNLLKPYENKGLGYRPLTEISSGFDNKFFEQYNKPPQNPRPHNR